MQAFQEKFRALQRDWLAQLPQRMGEARALLAACRAAPGDPGPATDLHRLLHTMAGSAGSFGQADLGRQAREAEHLLDDLLARPDRQPADFDPVAEALARLARAVPEA